MISPRPAPTRNISSDSTSVVVDGDSVEKRNSPIASSALPTIGKMR